MPSISAASWRSVSASTAPGNAGPGNAAPPPGMPPAGTLPPGTPPPETSLVRHRRPRVQPLAGMPARETLCQGVADRRQHRLVRGRPVVLPVSDAARETLDRSIASVRCSSSGRGPRRCSGPGASVRRVTIRAFFRCRGRSGSPRWGRMGRRRPQRGRLGIRRLGIRRLRVRRLGVRSLGARRPGARRLGARRLGTRRLGTRRLGTRRLGTRRLGTRRLGTRRLGTRRLGRRVAEPAGRGVVARHCPHHGGRGPGPQSKHRLPGLVRLAVHRQGGQFALPQRDPVLRQLPQVGSRFALVPARAVAHASFALLRAGRTIEAPRCARNGKPRCNAKSPSQLRDGRACYAKRRRE